MYFNLNLQNIKFNIIQEEISEEYIINILQKCYNNCAFSILPYMNNCNSQEAIEKYNSGDCVALCYYIKNYLKENNFISYLIPATIPDKYKMPNYLDISHVALLIPINANMYYLVDPAFYFLNPMIINLKNRNQVNPMIFSKNIYSNEYENDIIKYTTIEKIEYKLNKLESDQIFNQYQMIDKNTYYVTSNYHQDKTDTWNYYLIEVLNPDKAITTFFINIKKTPFISTTKDDNNSIIELDSFILIQNDSIKIKYGDESETILKHELTQENLDKINFKLHKFLNGNNINQYYNEFDGKIVED